MMHAQWIWTALHCFVTHDFCNWLGTTRRAACTNKQDSLVNQQGFHLTNPGKANKRSRGQSLHLRKQHLCTYLSGAVFDCLTFARWRKWRPDSSHVAQVAGGTETESLSRREGVAERGDLLEGGSGPVWKKDWCRLPPWQKQNLLLFTHVLLPVAGFLRNVKERTQTQHAVSTSETGTGLWCKVVFPRIPQCSM